MIIRNYGLFWDIQKVDWGWQNKIGSLKGYLDGDKLHPVDFREQAAIYALYDPSFNLVYVGQVGSQTQKLFSRLKQHLDDDLQNRWRYFSWFGVRIVNSSNTLKDAPQTVNENLDTILNHLEAIAISVSEPKLNKKGGSWVGAERYYQHDKATSTA
ncbi:MAG: hypothetical protein JSS75_05920 [Bacteroidetes bacterium]|nr:hypothetical protein [Bacteroidota bacterium]